MAAEDIIIVGAGPAGLATAIQLKRYGIHPVLFERERVGGLLHNANLVENYPGFPRGITGPRLVKLFTRQLKNLSISVIYEEVIDLDYEVGLFQVHTTQNSYTCKAAVIATGTMPLSFTNLAIPEDIRAEVFYEVYELLEMEGKRMVIVGSGDAAFDYALNLGRKNQVTILNRGEKPKCLPLLWERVQKTANITYTNNTEVCSLSKDIPGGILVDCRNMTGELQFHADYLVGAIGRVPQLGCLSETFLLQAQRLEEQGILYMIGDVKNGIFRQTSIAVGDGVMTAMKIYHHLKETA